jgi:hypothetical protein
MAYLQGLRLANWSNSACLQISGEILATPIPEKGGYNLWIFSRLDYVLRVC